MLPLALLKKFEELNRKVEQARCPIPQVLIDVQKVIKNDEFRDFAIKIADAEFKVHKFLLIARSPTLAEMIKNNPDADELILEDIEVDVFEIILNYIYNDRVPEKFDGKSSKLFSAAGKLKLEPLMTHVGRILLHSINDENCLEILMVASKFNDQKLKVKSFKQVKKIFRDKNLKDELMDDVEKLIKLKQMKDEFENLLMA